MVKVSDDFTLMIDYAHNAMSLESLLTTLREYEPARLVCLFGCGGNRSKLRRYEGKGHEDYQEIKGKKYPMDERNLIRDILAEQA